MILQKRFWYFLTLLCTLTVLSPALFAQQSIDITTIKVDDLSNGQIEELIKRANDAGLSTSEFLQMAQMRGMSEVEVEKLRRRLEEIGSEGTSGTASNRKPRKQIDLSEITQGLATVQEEIEAEESNIFGSSIFYQKKRRLSFEPNLNQATPKNYILGPSDLVFVDIYGQSEKYYEASVNPEGFILLDNVGPIYVSGKSI